MRSKEIHRTDPRAFVRAHYDFVSRRDIRRLSEALWAEYGFDLYVSYKDSGQDFLFGDHSEVDCQKINISTYPPKKVVFAICQSFSPIMLGMDLFWLLVYGTFVCGGIIFWGAQRLRLHLTCVSNTLFEGLSMKTTASSLDGLRRQLKIAESTRFLAHDLKSPLLLMKRFLDSSGAQKNTELLPSLNRQVTWAIDLIDHLRSKDLDLNWTSQSGVVEIEKLSFDIAKAFGRDDVDIAFGIDHTIRKEWIGGKIERILSNILSNALKSCSSQICVRSTIVDGQFLLQVLDDGVSEVDVFSRNLKKDDGLGLAFVKSSLAQVKGSLSMKRVCGWTVVSFMFPCSVPPTPRDSQNFEVLELDGEKKPVIPSAVVFVLSDPLRKRSFSEVMARHPSWQLLERSDELMMVRRAVVYSDCPETLEKASVLGLYPVASSVREDPESVERRITALLSRSFEGGRPERLS